jgi:hypothetical protein
LVQGEWRGGKGRWGSMCVVHFLEGRRAKYLLEPLFAFSEIGGFGDDSYERRGSEVKYDLYKFIITFSIISSILFLNFKIVLILYYIFYLYSILILLSFSILMYFVLVYFNYTFYLLNKTLQ